MSANIEVAAGDSAASPTPTAIRPRNSPEKPRARPHAAVARLQSAMPAMTMLRRLALSASHAIGMPTSA